MDRQEFWPGQRRNSKSVANPPPCRLFSFDICPIHYTFHLAKSHWSANSPKQVLEPIILTVLPSYIENLILSVFLFLSEQKTISFSSIDIRPRKSSSASARSATSIVKSVTKKYTLTAKIGVYLRASFTHHIKKSDSDNQYQNLTRLQIN